MAPKKTSNAMIPCDEIPGIRIRLAPSAVTELSTMKNKIKKPNSRNVLVCYDLKAGGEDYNSTWKAKVTSIQKSTGSKIKASSYKVWVTWFYRTSDVLEDAKEKKNDSKTMKAKKKNLRDQFLPALYHPRELFLSSHEQSIDPGCISKVIDVLHFDQGCPRPRVLDGCYFYRATYESSTKELTVAPEPTCNCDQPYVPHQEMQALGKTPAAEELDGPGWCASPGGVRRRDHETRTSSLGGRKLREDISGKVHTECHEKRRREKASGVGG
ncbi:hypothetical protein BJ138DRAFT_1120616 [Hygrophoropsis aurantiaca]|uniref:Uncharacterized protein n=1 Tax=Hygrophoropsis aurantiaca TaxID=72124 RepID=A0ACB7ZR81_9AGAM|nr:hypothetical protein BJ138DRAFT_1120616 [Hygrophoropsis aurantiaca]